MEKITLIMVFLLIPFFGLTQKKSEIIQFGIETKRFYEQDLSDGDKETYVYREEFYDYRGELIELKEYSNKGKDIDNWEKYNYDKSGNLIEEIELNQAGKIKGRLEITYNQNGLRIEKRYFDDRNRLEKVRKYAYEFRQ